MKKFLSYSFSAFFLLIIIVVAGLMYSYHSTLQYYNPQQAAISIEPGNNILDISFKLNDQKIISNSYAFLFYSFTHPGREKILPGIHTIPANSSIPEIFSYLQSDPNREIVMTFPEGETNQKVLSQIVDNYSFTEQDLEKELTTNNWKYELPFVPIDDNFEGFLFPDTYRFAADSSPEEILQRFIENFSRRWQEAKSEQKNQNQLTDYEILTLASIIEKEANADYNEKQIISGILQKRLEEGIALGVNSTLNYVLSDKKRIFSDYEINYPSQYNTYQNLGLPPTPICNPGLDSIKAALNPQDTDYYYFLHTPSQETKYAKTYDEHLDNINKYL